MLAFLKQIQYYAFAAILAAGAGAWALDHHSQFNKGHAAAVAEQAEAITKYQELLIAEQDKSAKALAELSTSHALEIANIEATKPKEVEKTRVIVKTIDRPAVCNVQPIELRDFTEAVRAANLLPPEPGTVSSNRRISVPDLTDTDRGFARREYDRRGVEGLGQRDTT